MYEKIGTTNRKLCNEIKNIVNVKTNTRMSYVQVAARNNNQTAGET